MNRRRFLRQTSLLVVAACLPLAGLRRLLAAPGRIPTGKLLASLESLPGVSKIAMACLALRRPDERAEYLERARKRFPLWLPLARLRQSASDDYDKAAVTDAGGWILSESEAQALVAANRKNG